jgi:hypothetical protein
MNKLSIILLSLFSTVCIADTTNPATNQAIETPSSMTNQEKKPGQTNTGTDNITSTGDQTITDSQTNNNQQEDKSVGTQ